MDVQQQTWQKSDLQRAEAFYSLPHKSCYYPFVIWDDLFIIIAY